ncbi:MAG: MFS transporter [Burkholderiaceae bacterium]|nr:MFS transporter [Burkholderiaceae bacterium]
MPPSLPPLLPPPPAPRARGFHLPPAWIVVLSGIVVAMHVGKMPPAIPVLQQALGVSLVQAGFLLSAVQLAGMGLGVLAGMAADGLGLRRSLLIGQAILAAASLAGMGVDSPTGLLALRALEGAGFLLAALPSPNLIRQLVRPAQLPLYLGLWSTYMGTGIALALLGGPTAMQWLGWQGWWGLLGLCSAAMVAWVWLQIPSDARRSQAAPPAAPADAEPWGARLRLTLRHRGPWQVALLFSMYSSQWLAVIGFLPTLYAQAGFSATRAGALTALASWINVVGNLAAGRLLQQGWCARHLLYTGFASMAGSAVLVFGPWTSEWPVLRYLAVLAFSAVGGLVPGVLFSLAVRVAPSERTVSTTVGWMQQCSSAGQFLGPPLVAWVAGSVGGWHWTWALTGAAACIGLLGARRVRFQATA